MQLLAGYTIGWAAIVAFVAICMLAAYTNFRDNRDYLAFAAFCTFICVSDATRVAQVLGVSVASGVVLERILIACAVLASAALLLLALNVPGREMENRSGIGRAIMGSALLLAGLSLAGLAVDAGGGGGPLLASLYDSDPLLGSRTGPIGYAAILASTGYAVASGFLFSSDAKRRGKIRTASLLLTLVLLPLGIHDMLVAGGLVPGLAFGEQSGHAVTALLLLVLLKRYDSSRRLVEQRARDLRQAERRVDRATNEIDKLKPMADLGKLSASLAHEIRNPLSVLVNVASALKRGGPDHRGSGRFNQLVSMLHEETERLSRLVDDLLLFARTGRTTKETIEPESLVQAAVSDVRKLLPLGSEIDLQVEIEPGLDTFLGSPEGLRRALSNLIDNAVKSSAGKGEIQVIARRDGNAPELLLIGVRDQAGGVPNELVDTIFDPFFSTRTKGTGLGLSIASNVIQAHAGALLLENRPGKGATFWIRIPTSATPNEEPVTHSGTVPLVKTASAA